MSLGKLGRLAVVASVILAPITIRASIHDAAGQIRSIQLRAGVACFERKAAYLHRTLNEAEEQECWRERDAAVDEARKRNMIVTAVNVLTVLLLVW